jgi:hypothetical protein
MNNSFPVCITAKYDQQIIVLEFDADTRWFYLQEDECGYVG